MKFFRRSLVFLVPVASTVGFGFVGCGSSEEPARNESVATSSLRLAFPSEAQRIFELGEPLVESEGVFVRAPEAVRPKRSLSVRLPKRGSEPIVLRAPTGFEVRLRQDVEAEAKLVGKAVAYGREGASAYWAIGTRGAEAWIELRQPSPNAAALSWQVEGGRLRHAEGIVEVLDEAGIAHLRLAPPVAHAEEGGEIPVRLEVREGQIDFFVEGEGAFALLEATWTSTGSMTTPRVLHTATKLENGKVLVVGGKSGSADSTVLGSAEIFDPATETFTLVVPASGSLLPRFAHSANLLRDGTGRVVVAGGFQGASMPAHTSVQLYDPTSNTWTDTVDLSEGRGAHGAVALPNGWVMVAGGMRGNDASS